MTASNILLGITIGVPLMLIAGPVSMMLLDRGLSHGARGVAPAVAGVAGADLVLALVASLGAGAVTSVLIPIEGALTTVAVLILAVIAVWMWRGASRQLTTLSASGAKVRRSERGTAQLVGVSGGGSVDVAHGASPEHDLGAPDLNAPVVVAAGSAASAVTPLRGSKLAGTFFAVTVVNPLSLVLLASIVVAGGPGVGTLGWAVGMAIGSAIAHGAYGFAGAAIGGRLDETGVARIRLGGAVVVAAMAIALHLGVL